MAQTLAQITRTVTTDFTVAATKKTARNAIAANMSAMDNLAERELKAAQIIALAYLLKSGVTVAAGTDYTSDYVGLMQQAIALMQPIVSRLDTKQKNLLEATLAVNAGYYASSTAGLLDVNTGMGLAKALRAYSAEELDYAIAFLRFKAGI